MNQNQNVGRFAYERALHAKGIHIIAGVDEVGRGPLAGPVVAAAVVLPVEWIASGKMPESLESLNDSKQLSAAQREDYFGLLTQNPQVRYAVARVDAAMIDEINILRATHLAMAEALNALLPGPEHILVDGLPVRSLSWPQTALVKGDSRSYSIAAASVIAKVTRDRLMIDLDRQYPQYAFAAHKGYGTRQHLEAISRHGPCMIHRKSFAPIRPDCQQSLFRD